MSPIGAANDLAAGCKVALGGSPLDPALADQIMEVRVETTVGLPDVCTIRLYEDADTSGTLKVIDDARFELGKPLKVKLAKAIGGQPGDVFDGEITTIEAELGSSVGGAPVLELTVTAHDRSHRMHRKTTTRTFRQTTVSDIARKMAGEHGVKVGTARATCPAAPPRSATRSARPTGSTSRGSSRATAASSTSRPARCTSSTRRRRRPRPRSSSTARPCSASARA